MSDIERYSPARNGTKEDMALVKKWGYDYRRAFEYPGHDDPATPKQSAFIESLATEFPQEASELEQVVNAYSESGCHALAYTSKGNAMWVIQKLLDLQAKKVA